jgi:hypothetical protein
MSWMDINNPELWVQVVRRPAPIETRIEWADYDQEFGQRKVLTGTLRLHCGHVIAVQSTVDRRDWRDAGPLLKESLTRRLRHAEEHHDCEAFEQAETVRRVTEKLTRRTHAH